MSTAKQTIHILLADDNPADIDLLQEAFSESNVNIQLHIAHDGVEAIQFLYHMGEYQHAKRPDLIILDLNMPRMSGSEVLAKMHEDAMHSIPIVVLSTSRNDNQLLQFQKFNFTTYISKPVNFSKYLEVAQQILVFYLATVSQPISN